jgi:hypothetical protein
VKWSGRVGLLRRNARAVVKAEPDPEPVDTGMTWNGDPMLWNGQPMTWTP